MGLFKSKAERKMERDLEIRKGINHIKRQIRDLDRNEKDYITKAKRARKMGANDQFSFLRKTLKKTASQKILLERQLLNIETAYQIKNQAEAHAQFAKSMNAVSHSIAETFGATDLAATQRDFEQALMKAESMEQQMEIFLDSVSETMGMDPTSSADLVSDEDIDRMVDAEIVHEEGEPLDAEISDGLKEIEKELGKE
ncbi:MAG: hypothetical protein O7H41_18135 [Planctomycetota bacterium]|nr:hypothetical protein [Planctomycetota bacterium]